jgi:hypothetical protein
MVVKVEYAFDTFERFRPLEKYPMKMNTRISTKVGIGILLFFMEGCFNPSLITPSLISTTIPTIQPEPITVDITVSVPYWTEGEIFLGIGENPTYLKLSARNEITYTGTITIIPDVEYYFSRGSLDTRSTTSFKLTDKPQGLNAVVNWVDSVKTINMPDFQKGVIFGGMLWRPDELAIPGIIDYNLDMAKSFGINSIGLVNTWFMFPDCSNPEEIKPFYESDGVWPEEIAQGWSEPTLTDEQLGMIISKAKERGFSIFLKPLITTFAVGPNNHPLCYVGITNWDRWFDQYTNFILHFAELSEENGVDMLAIGTELDIPTTSSMTGAPPDATARWLDLITRIRSVYSGKITYSVSCGINPEKWDEFPCHAPKDVQFWEAVDYIGFEPYFPITQKLDPTISELKDGFGSKLDSASYTFAKQLSETYQKPIIFTEYSLRGYDGANLYQQNTPPNPILDQQEQADMQEAVFQALEERPWIQGMYHWAWYLINPDDNMKWQLNDINNFSGTLCGQVMKKWFLNMK